MPEVGEEIIRGGKKFKYQGYGYWGEVVDKTTITGTVPLPDGGATSSNQSSALLQQQDSNELIGKLIKQLKINNIHLSLITDNEVKETEIE